MSGAAQSVNKAFNDIGTFVSHPFGTLFDSPSAQPTPTAGGPPDPGSIRQQNFSNQVEQERKQAQQSSFSAQQSLLDQPTTASRVLLGS